jgi:hypothetical protein
VKPRGRPREEHQSVRYKLDNVLKGERTSPRNQSITQATGISIRKLVPDRPCSTRLSYHRGPGLSRGRLPAPNQSRFDIHRHDRNVRRCIQAARGGIPAPVSATLTSSHLSPICRASTVISPHLGEFFRALSRRLAKTCSKRSISPITQLSGPRDTVYFPPCFSARWAKTWGSAPGAR